MFGGEGECPSGGIDYPPRNFLGYTPVSIPCHRFLQADGILYLTWARKVHGFERAQHYLGEAVLLYLISLRHIIDAIHVDIGVLEAGRSCRWQRGQVVEAGSGEVRCTRLHAGGKGDVGFIGNSFRCSTE